MNTTISAISKLINDPDRKGDISFWGVVKDKIYSGDICTGYMVSLGDDEDIIECRRLAGANIGDTVFVTVTPNGSMTVTGRIDGDQDNIDTKEDLNTNYSTTLATINLIYPVGITIEFRDDVDPNEKFPGTTWQRFAQGRTTIGAGTSDRQFVAGTTGGESTHKLTSDESGQKAVTTGSYYGADGAHQHGGYGREGYTMNSSLSNMAQCSPTVSGAYSITQGTQNDGAHYHSIQGSNADNAHNNLPPYVVVYKWVRTA